MLYYDQNSFFAKCTLKVETGKKNVCQISQKNVVPGVVRTPFVHATLMYICHF